jgi:hypothetical protein
MNLGPRTCCTTCSTAPSPTHPFSMSLRPHMIFLNGEPVSTPAWQFQTYFPPLQLARSQELPDHFKLSYAHPPTLGDSEGRFLQPRAPLLPGVTLSPLSASSSPSSPPGPRSGGYTATTSSSLPWGLQSLSFGAYSPPSQLSVGPSPWDP